MDTTIFNRVVRGTVLDSDRTPLIGANVIIRGTPFGTLTDIDGNYEIRVREHDQLLISYTGYGFHEVNMTQGSAVESVLNEEEILQEVVVTNLDL